MKNDSNEPDISQRCHLSEVLRMKLKKLAREMGCKQSNGTRFDGAKTNPHAYFVRQVIAAHPATDVAVKQTGLEQNH